MENRTRIYSRIAVVTVFIAIPLAIYALSDFPRRTWLKELISVLTIGGFFMMMLQIYLSRANSSLLKGFKMKGVINWHKTLGYVFVSMLLVHPLFIVIPRFFESGVEPIEAFFQILAEWDSKGIFLGLIAWSLVLILMITSFFRKHIGMKYKTWRVFHGILSIVFISAASFHIATLGRHASTIMIAVFATLVIIGTSLLLRIYIFKKS